MIQVCSKFEPLNQPAPYKIIEGGRAGMKSHSVAEILLELAKQNKLRILCAREIQKSITESVHQLLRDKIAKLGFQGFYRVGNTEIVGANGSQFLFAGLKTNFASIKSKEGIDIVWVEEAAKVSKESWQVLLPTIRKEGAEVWVTFNPEDEDDPVLELKKKPGAVCIKVGWQDNPWISKRTLNEIRFDYQNDAETADHVWGGGFRKKSNAVIFAGRYRVERLVSPETLGFYGPYYGADWGFAQDPVTLMKLWYNPGRRQVYVEKEAYGVGVLQNDIAALWKEYIPESRVEPSEKQEAAGLTWYNLRQPIIRADNSRPETIAHLRGYGFCVIPAEKWPGSVEDGVEWLRSQTIIINPDCVHQEQEAKSYKYKVDPLTGDVQPVIVDKHNHCWDADRYGLEEIIKVGEVDVVVATEEAISTDPDLDDLGFLNGLEEMSL